MIRSKIISVGAYVPPNIVTNDDLSKMMDTSHEWIVQRTGIEERRWVNPDQGASDLALVAAREAISRAGMTVADIDMIVFATLSPDYDFPGTGCQLQALLDAGTIPAYDIRQQCSGFIYGMSLADQFIRTETYKTVLVVGAEVHSRGLDKTTRGRDVTVLFGDGAGAVVMQSTKIDNPKTDAGVWSLHLHSEGKYAKELALLIPGSAGGRSSRVSEEDLRAGAHYPVMNGKRVYTHAVRRMAEVLNEAFEKNNVTVDDIDLFLFHQANLRINEAVSQQLKIPASKVHNTIQKFGNTTAATIPLGMDDAIKQGKLKKGDLVAVAAFGSGFTWAGGLFRF